MALPTPAELEALTEEDLETLRINVVQEQHRRVELRTLPATVEQLTQRFVDHGGDPAKIKNPNSYVKGPKP